MRPFNTIVIVPLFFFSFCNNFQKTNNSIVETDNNIDVEYITNLNQYSKFIGGDNVDVFEDIQKKDFYKIYQRAAITNWNFFYTNLLSVISSWSVSNNLTNDKDSLTVFYPFSGPDLPFVFSFYPYAKNYILVGLENVGQIPQIDKMSDLEIDRYLNALSSSMTDYFLNGYFSTANLKKSFRSLDMNGIIHPMLFFINKLGFQIMSFRYFYINAFGDIEYIEQIEPICKKIRGFEFKISDQKSVRTVYYVQFDLSDQNMQFYPEFQTFISNFGKKNIFLKSASYLLHTDQFSAIRTLILRQFAKIIQDDSGISYKTLKDNNYSIQLYGNYKQTLNIFNKYFQKDLKEAYNTHKPKQLPYRFGYNIPFDQTTIIFVQNNNIPTIKYPFFTVQFKMSWNRLTADSLPQIADIDYYYDEGYYKYICGKYQSIDQAKQTLQNLRKLGYKDAFIIEFYKNAKKYHNEL